MYVVVFLLLGKMLMKSMLFFQLGKMLIKKMLFDKKIQNILVVLQDMYNNIISVYCDIFDQLV